MSIVVTGRRQLAGLRVEAGCPVRVRIVGRVVDVDDGVLRVASLDTTNVDKPLKIDLTPVVDTLNQEVVTRGSLVQIEGYYDGLSVAILSLAPCNILDTAEALAILTQMSEFGQGCES